MMLKMKTKLAVVGYLLFFKPEVAGQERPGTAVVRILGSFLGRSVLLQDT